MKKAILMFILLIGLSSLVVAGIRDDIFEYYTFDDAQTINNGSDDILVGIVNGINGNRSVNVITGYGGINKQAYNFTQADATTVELDEIFLANATASISAWINTSYVGGVRRWFYYFGGNKGFGINADKLFLEYGVGSLTSTNTINNGTWIHVAFTRTIPTNNTCLYINGNQEDCDIITGYSLIDANFGGTSGQYWDGEIDEVTLYNQELTQSDITSLYNGGTGNFYPFGAIFESPETSPQTNNTIPSPLFNIECDTGDIDLWFNESISLNDSHLVLNDAPSPTTYTPTNLIEGTYYYIASCDNGATNSSILTWILDSTAPTITLNSDNFYKLDNSTSISRLNDNTNLSILFEDSNGIFAYEINITNSTGDTLYFNQSTDLSTTELNLSLFVNLTNFNIGNMASKITVSDLHTDNLIGKYLIVTRNKELTFFTEERNFITISSNLDADTSYIKKPDRYSFDFDFGTTTTEEKIFTLECDGKLYFRPNSKYKAHFICSKDGISGNWIDMEGVDGKPIINKINDQKYTITFAQLDNKITFNSIGGLNVQTLTNSFNISIFFPLNPYIQVGTPDDVFEWNFTGEFNQRQNMSLNETLLNNILDDGCNCTGCSIVNDNCRIPILIHSDDVGILNFNIFNSTYEYGISDCTDTTFNHTILNMTYFDERTLSPIITTNNYNLLMQSPFTQNIFGTFTAENTNSICSNINITARGLTYDIYGDLTLSSSGYSTRIISNNQFNPYLTQTNPFYSLPMYMIDNSNVSQVTYTISDAITTAALVGVQASMYRVINGSSVLVEAKISDVTGKVVFDYLTDTRYRFEFSIAGYNTGIFDQNPINANSFEVNLFKTTALNNTQDYDRIVITWVPIVFGDSTITNFNFTIVSIYSEFTSYGYTITYPGGTDTNTGTNSAGETLNTNFNIVGATVFDKVKLEYFYDMPITGRRNFTLYYSISVTPGNNTMVTNRGNTYGLGLFERIFIATLVVLMIVGITTLVGQPVTGSIFGLFIWSYFVAVGFIPIWAILIPIFGGVLLASKS